MARKKKNKKIESEVKIQETLQESTKEVMTLDKYYGVNNSNDLPKVEDEVLKVKGIVLDNTLVLQGGCIWINIFRIMLWNLNYVR